MKKLLLSSIALISIVNLSAQPSNVFSMLPQIDSVVATIPYVFEGTIQSVEVYAGDASGNRLPKSSVTWSGNTGQYPSYVKGFSLANIYICKIYKGTSGYLRAGQTLQIKSKSFTLDNVFLQRRVVGSVVDTIVRWVDAQPDDESKPVIVPATSYSKKIYFSDKFVNPSTVTYSSWNYLSNFHSLYEIPFNVPVDVKQPDGSYQQILAYAALVPYVFTSSSQLSYFLSQITGITSTATEYCSTYGTKETPVTQVGANPFNIAVYPNPSSIDETFKVKFDLSTEQDVSFILKDISGKVVYTNSIGQQKSIDYDLATKVETGIYFLQVNFGSNSQTFKLSKN